MLWRLLLLMTVVPTAELYLLIRIGRWMGAAETVALVLLTGAFGAWIARREGGAALRRIQDDLRQGVAPAQGLVEGGLVLAGAVLLITPGVLTDLAGILFILPLTRRPIARRLRGWAAKRVSFTTNDGTRVEAGPIRPVERGGFDHPVS